MSTGMPNFLDFSSNASRSSLNLWKASSTSSKQPSFFLQTFIKQYLEDLYICSLNSAKGSVQCFFPSYNSTSKIEQFSRKITMAPGFEPFSSFALWIPCKRIMSISQYKIDNAPISFIRLIIMFPSNINTC